MAEAALADDVPPRALAEHARSWGPPLALILLLALVPPLAQALDEPFLIRLFTRVVVFAIAAVALNFVLGFGGLVSLVHAGFFGIGGYVIAILASHDMNAEPVLSWPMAIPGTSNLALSLPLAAATAGAFAAAVGLVSLRTSGTYFIMITLAFNQMLYYVAVALQRYGGEDGLQILSTLHLAGVDATRRVPFYYAAVAVLAAALVLVGRMVESRFGMVIRASAENERRLVALGVPPLRYKLLAFAISGAIAGLAGALLATGQQFVSPADMSWVRSGDLVVMAVLGGLSTVWGPVLGATVFLIFEFLLSSWTVHWQLPFGVMVIAIVVFLRGGLASLGGARLSRLRERSTRRSRAGEGQRRLSPHPDPLAQAGEGAGPAP
jgi:branched-chain amino acid transport system permease protein